MKKLLPLLFLFAACSKSNTTPPTPDVVPKVTVVSARVDSATMYVKVNIIKSTAYSKLTLVIYKTDITGVDYKYPISIKDGDQEVVCNHYSDASPMSYQVQYGTTYSSMMTLTY